MQKQWLFLALIASAACGGTGASDSGAPVKAQALSGTIQGKSFTGQSAIARTLGSSTQVTIYGKNVTCTDNVQLMDGEAEILFSVANWMDGASYALNLDLSNLSSSRTVTFVVQQGSTPNNLIIGTGRVEVQKAGGMGSNGLIGLRATDPMYGSVEGTVSVQICP
jgi:hypothetical protein